MKLTNGKLPDFACDLHAMRASRQPQQTRRKMSSLV
jgi:hypothetical protein